MCEEMIKNPYRRVWACVNLDALHDNLRQIAACRKNDAGIIAVIKADGYGHGAVMLAREMDEIPEVIGYAVATEEEAVLLADAGIKKPAMVLGYTFPEAYEEMALRGVHATVFTDQMLEDMNRAAQKAGKKMHVHIAVDTGMSRGFLPILRQRMKQINPERMCSMKNFRALPTVWKRSFP